MLKRIRRNRLRHTGTFQKPAIDDTLDSHGQKQVTWPTICRRRISVDELSGTELENARKKYSLATHRMRFDHVEDLNTDARIKIRDRIFQIGFIEDSMLLGVVNTALCSEAR